jgi:tetratricopeptide (TPR) repeat protein
MRKVKQIKLFLVVGLCILTAACSTRILQSDSMLTSRQQLAVDFEQDKRLADALVQWQILQLAYPQNDMVVSNISRLSSLIEGKVEKLISDINQRKGKSSSYNPQVDYLKVLALAPDNEIALTALRGMELKQAYQAASQKTAAIKNSYKVKQITTQKLNEVDSFQAQADSYQAQGQTQALLELIDVFLMKHPDHQGAMKYRYDSYVKLGERELATNKIEDAVEYFELALSVKGMDNKALLAKNNLLKVELSKQYYLQGIQSIKTNIDDAVVLFQSSVFYNPKNLKAQQQLNRASKIQKNLRRISGK